MYNVFVRLVRNPSYKHSEEIISKFNQYKDSIYYKDHTQYTDNMIDSLLFSIEESKKLGIKSSHILWLTKQLWNDKVDSKKRVEEDYLPLVKTHFMNQSLLQPIDYYPSMSELNQAINNLSEDDIVSEKDYDIFHESNGWLIAMPHTTQASCILGKDTNWCTARTKSQNLFLSYVGRYEDDIVLFYIIKINGNTKSNPNDKLSVGFEDGVPVFDGDNGGLTVNAINNGFSIEDFREILGKELAKEFLVKMDEKCQSIKGKHPAKREIEKIAKSVDKYLRKISEFKNEEHLRDFKRQIVKYPINEEIQIILSKDKDEDVRRYLTHKGNITEKVQLALTKDMDEEVKRNLALNTNLTEKTQLVLIKDTDEWVINFLATNKKITEKVQILLIKNASKTIKVYLAQNPSITEKIQLILTEEISEEVIRNLSKNPNITERVQLILMEDIPEWVRGGLALNPRITEKIQLLLTQDMDDEARINLARNLNITEKTQIALMKDVNELVVNYLASNPNITERVQLFLTEHANEEVRRYLAQNRKITEKAQLVLMKDSNEKVRKFLAQNPSILEKVQLILTEDTDEWVRRHLAKNKNLTERAQLILTKDADGIVRVNLFRNPNITDRVRIILKS